jgi:methionine-rich copper-binding protein CopC
MRIVLGAVLGVCVASAALARTMVVVGTTPAENAVVSPENAQYSVRFDGLVDHNGSTLTITQGDQVVATLHALLNAAPNTLFAMGPRLGAGDYQLRWAVRSQPDGEMTEGSVAFSVRK